MTSTAAPKMTAVERRYLAIRTLCDAVRTYDPEAVATTWTESFETRADVATAIRALAPLGRTERWTVNVECWARNVEEAEDEEHFRFAFDQYGVWTSYAAE